MNPRWKCADCGDARNNQLGVQECWSLKEAKLGRFKMVHIDLPPPYKGIKTEWKPTCYRRPRFVKVDPSTLTKDGYRKGW